MKVFYFLSSYISHLKAGREFIKCLHLINIDTTDKIELADVVIIHKEPYTYPAYFKKFPILKNKYVIGYAVYETEVLPCDCIDGLQAVNEVWTCSEYSYQILKKYFNIVYKIPFVIPKNSFREDKVEAVKKRIQYNENNYYFYTIVDALNPRKNLCALLYCFLEEFSGSDKKAFLIIKQYAGLSDLSSLPPNVITINDNVDDEYIKALHYMGDCYISPHCAEAWGLSIADAMSFGKLTIATGYSGNMEYMNTTNSFPVKYQLKTIEDKDIELFTARFGRFNLSKDVEWAYIDLKDLAEKMRYCYCKKRIPILQDNARKISEVFSHAKIAQIIKARLDEISQANSIK